MLEKLKACGSWLLGLLALLAAVLFGANMLRGRKQSEAGNESAPVTKAPMVEAQAKETDVVNTKVEEINEVKPPAKTPKDKNMEAMLEDYDRL